MNLKTAKQISIICNRSAQYIDQEIRREPPVLNLVSMGRTESGKQRVRIDLDGPLTQEFIRSRLGHVPTNVNLGEEKKIVVLPKKPPPKKPKEKKIKKAKLVKSKKKADKPEPIIVEDHRVEQPLVKSLNPYNGLAASGDTKLLKDQKLEEEIEKIKIDNEQKRGALIDKKLIVLVFNKLATIDENQFRGLNIRVGPKIIALDAKRNIEKAGEIAILFDKENDQGFKTEVAKILNSGESEKSAEISEILEEDTGKILKNIQREFKDYLEIMEKKGT